MDISPKLKEWLNNCEKLLAGKRRLAEAGGHIILRSDTYDPEDLDEPMRSEAIQYLDLIRASNNPPATNDDDLKVKFLPNKNQQASSA